MGDRVSMQFVDNDGFKSVVLFSHWGGLAFVEKAKKYVENLKTWIKSRDSKVGMPLTRLEPNTVMVDFIRHFTKDMNRVESDLYLGIHEDDGDNSDNGHFEIKL